MTRDMTKGEPEPGDRGLDNTHTWARTYWGGALFCLRADISIRQATDNRMGLQDALRAIVRKGGTLDKEDWSLERALKVGDAATRTNVLEQLYADMKDEPVQIDLPRLWVQLGISANRQKILLDDGALLGGIRRSITQPSEFNRDLVAQLTIEQ